jgi:YD repeat-containing protein
MPTLSKQFTVSAPAQTVWEVIGPGFGRIGEWATAIPASAPIPAAPPPSGGPAGPRTVAPGLIDAPVTGRVCTTGLRMVPQVTETLVAYDDAGRTLTYHAAGLPTCVTTARNTWTVTPVDESHCRVTLDARFDTHGLLGALVRWLLLVQVGRTSRHLAEDLRHFVEHSTPSPRKQRQRDRR